MGRLGIHGAAAWGIAALVGVVALPACGAIAVAAPGTVGVVAAENEYGDVAAQVGGAYVTVHSIESDPNTDPHAYEVSPSVAQEVAEAQLVIQNGVGYDDFVSRLEAASPESSRAVIDVQHVLGLPDSTSNPHLWYDPRTMPAVADAVAADLAGFQPAHAAYFRANAADFIASLQPWYAAIAQFRAAYPNTPVATTEPVADYLLQAAGTNNLTPFRFQADIMNGIDPAPQDVSLQESLITEHRVKVLCYNQQVTDSLTESFITLAQQHGIPVVGVYETMPTPGYHYQSWMLAETIALRNAVADGASTQRL